MATASDIKMRIFAEDKTAKAFNSAKSNMTKFAASAKVARNAVLAIGAAVGALGVATKKMAADADDIIKFSKRTSIATDTLQELGYVASQTGVSAETFNKAILTMVKNFSDARDGTGMAVDEIRRLGLTLTDTNNQMLPVEQLMNQLSDALAGVTNDTERLAIATAIFGVRGSMMLQMLDGGSQKMNELRQRARDLGIVLSKETLIASEEITDSFDDMSRAVKSNLTVALVELKPVILQMSEFLIKASKAAREFFSQFMSPQDYKTIEGVEERIKKLMEQKVNIQMQMNNAAEKGLEKTFQHLYNEQVKLNNEISQLRKRKVELLNEQGAEEVAARKKVAAVQDDLDKMQQGVKKGMATYKTQWKGIVDETADATVRAFKGMEDALVEFTMTGKLNFKDLARSIIADLIRIQIRQSMVGAISKGLNFFGTSGAGSPAPVEDHSIFKANLAGGGFTGMGARSGGIDGKGGFPAIIHPNETVIDHAQGQTYGNKIVQNINVTTGVSQTVRAEIANMMPQIIRAAQSATADARMRGGSYSSAMGA